MKLPCRNHFQMLWELDAKNLSNGFTLVARQKTDNPTLFILFFFR